MTRRTPNSAALSSSQGSGSDGQAEQEAAGARGLGVRSFWPWGGSRSGQGQLQTRAQTQSPGEGRARGRTPSGEHEAASASAVINATRATSGRSGRLSGGPGHDNSSPHHDATSSRQPQAAASVALDHVRGGQGLSPRREATSPRSLQPPPPAAPHEPASSDAPPNPTASVPIFEIDVQPAQTRPDLSPLPLEHDPGLRVEPMQTSQPPLSPAQAAPGGGGGVGDGEGGVDGRAGDEEALDPPAPMLRELDSREISREQLVAEVKGVYAGLVMVESKCIEVDNGRTNNMEKLTDQQYQAMIALHRTLLHEHHDFFLASHHPAGTPALRNLAAKYAMAARMWRHGIHTFLEILRQRLPGSIEHMLAFLYHAYCIVGVFYETVPAYQETWLECLGDLSRYRMVIETDDKRDYQLWSANAASWYSKATDFRPNTGRLCHHLAILSRTNLSLQLAYYLKALVTIDPFVSSKDSIRTVFESLRSLSGKPSLEVHFARYLMVTFNRDSEDQLDAAAAGIVATFDGHIQSHGEMFAEYGYALAICITAVILAFNEPGSLICNEFAIARSRKTTQEVDLCPSSGSEDVNYEAIQMTMERGLALNAVMLPVILRRKEDDNVLSFITVMLAFLLCSLRNSPTATAHLTHSTPWDLLADFLNSLVARTVEYFPYDFSSVEQGFETDSKGHGIPIPEDWMVRGMVWSDDLFPDAFFPVGWEHDDKMFEDPEVVARRARRVLHLGYEIGQLVPFLACDPTTGTFSAEMPDIDMG